MKDLKKLSLKKEVKKEAEEIEKEVSRRSDLEDISVSDDMEASLFNKIQEYEYDRRFKKVYRRKKRRYVIAALAAVIVLVCGSVITGVGSKSYWKVMWERINGDGFSMITNVENMESQTTEDIDEMGVYKEINKKIGVSAVRLGYKPENMELIRYTLDEEQEKASLFYDYHGEIVRYSLYINDADSSFGQKSLDQLSEEYQIKTNGIIIDVQEFIITDSDRKRYIAEFEYKDIHYQLKGVMDRKEFEQILENLIFL